jgi:hypothetical protein
MLIRSALVSPYLKVLFGRVPKSRFGRFTTYTIMRLELRLDPPESYIFESSTES